MKQTKTDHIHIKVEPKLKADFIKFVNKRGYTQSSALTVIIIRILNGEIKL